MKNLVNSLNNDNYINSLSIISKIKNKYDIKIHLSNTIKYPLFTKHLYFKNLSFAYKETFNSPNRLIPNYFNSSSCSIIKHPLFTDRYILNIRCVNYSLNLLGYSSITQEHDTCLTSNAIIILDTNLNIIYNNIYHPEILDTPFIGIEDIRLFSFNKELFYIGSSYDKITNKIKITSSKFKLNQNYKLNFIRPTFNTNFNWEKNWVFFENNNEMFIIYKWFPIYICEIDYKNNTLNLYKTINVPDVFSNFRGSTNGVLLNNKIWFIIHSQININNKNHYYHRFVVLNNDLTLYGYSKMFKFENYLVEFCIGLELSYRNKFLITYSTLDSTTKLIVLDVDYIQSIINLYNLT
jgi:hypothetical protein